MTNKEEVFDLITGHPEGLDDDDISELTGIKPRQQIQQLTGENEQLQSQILQLEGELQGMAGKETQIRDRLRTILSKIDTIESELTSNGSSA